jgi:stage II sporulation protein D
MLMLERQKIIRIALWLSVMLITAFLTIIFTPFSSHKHVNRLNSNQSLSSQISDRHPKTSLPSNETNLADRAPAANASLIVPIYLSQTHEIARVPIEQYVSGVVAAEMPPEFSLEALKAQAIAARTYIIRRVVQHDYSGMPVKGAWVTDTVAHQAYLTNLQLQKNWGAEKYTTNMVKINQAVHATENLIITYADEPINATFFSTSNGYTENSEDYWGVYEPYLRSVSSPWDVKLSPKFKNTVQMPVKQFLTKLGLQATRAMSEAIPASISNKSKTAVELSQGHRIAKMRIAGKPFTGKDIRERLSLSSSDFTWLIKGSNIEITSTGSGHGVGMSQWGANGMALEGYKADSIIKHYYTGTEIQSDLKYMKL